MKIAIEGCMHGELEKVYATIAELERAENTKIDLLICCGDFQAVRNEKDLESLSVPQKFKKMNTFWKYYSGKSVAPVPTIFIGGNHEASNYLWELYYGGWAAPNIYFLGFAGVVKFGNVRIGGLSGIYNARHYHLGHFERPPYNASDIRSVYHVRDYDVQKLMQIVEPLDIFLSHDWPVGITDCGDWQTLIRQKPFFKQEVEQRSLGSKAAAQLLQELKPSYWFSAHLHCKFAALVEHEVGGPVTQFLALDKCLPNRRFLQVIEVQSEPGPYEILYDEEWLSITRRFNSVLPLGRSWSGLRSVEFDADECRRWVKSRLQERGAKPFKFTPTASFHGPEHYVANVQNREQYKNPQTEAFLQLLGLPYLLDRKNNVQQLRRTSPSDISGGFLAEDVEAIPIDDEDELEILSDEDE